MFFLILSMGLALVALQGWLSFNDGYLTRDQMLARGISYGYPFTEHGGMTADVFIISPLVAYLVSHYRLPYASIGSLLAFVISLATVLSLGKMYASNSYGTPEAHVHQGRTTPAGWVHGLFALLGLWVCVLFYTITPHVEGRELIGVSAVLTIFFPLGAMKFAHRWKWDASSVTQVAIGVSVLWMATAIRILW